jgi:hypothetical protein
MRYLLTATGIALSCLLTGLSGKGQQIVDVSKNDFALSMDHDVRSTITGMVYQNVKYVRVTEGSPFFMDQWMKARLFDADGNSYADNAVRLNLMDNQVHFLDASGNEIVATTPVRLMRLTDTTTGAQYTFIMGDRLPAADKSLAKTWFQVLVNDKVSLCLQIKKTIHEDLSYRSSTTEEQIINANWYFVQINNSFVRVKTWTDLLQLFNDKKDAVDSFVHDHHLKGKSTEDYIQLVQFYNSSIKS